MSTIDETINSVASNHSETLAIDPASITSERADKLMSKSGVQSTTELLLLLVRFHADVDDTAGAQLLADFASKFSALESTVV